MFPRHEVGPAAPVRDLASGFGTEELHLRRDAAGAGRLGHVRGRLDAEHRDARRLEVLQQVAVVAGHLGDQAVAVRPSRAVIVSAYRFACATQESEYEEK